MGTASSKAKDEDTAVAGSASPARHIKVPKPSKELDEEKLPTIAPPADLLVAPTAVADVPTAVVDAPTSLVDAPTSVADSDETDKPTELLGPDPESEMVAPRPFTSIGPTSVGPTCITHVGPRMHRPAPPVDDDDAPHVPYVPPPPRNVVEVEKRTPDAAARVVAPANDGVEDAIASRYHLAVSALGAGAPRADVFVATKEYGPGACDVTHLCVCSREGDCAVYEDGNYGKAPRKHKIPLAAGDEVVAGVYGGYGVRLILITALGVVYQFDPTLRDTPPPVLCRIPAPDGDASGRIVSAAATTGSSPFAVAYERGRVVMVAADGSIAQSAEVGRPITKIALDYYGGFIAAQHANEAAVSLLWMKNSRSPLALVGRVRPHALFEPAGGRDVEYQRDAAASVWRAPTTTAAAADAGAAAAAATGGAGTADATDAAVASADASEVDIVSMSGDGTDLFVTCSDGSGFYVKCFESSSVPHIRMEELAPSPAALLRKHECSRIAAVQPLALLGNFICGLPGGRIGLVYAPEWQPTRGDYRTCDEGPDGAAHDVNRGERRRVFGVLGALPAEGGCVSRVVKLKGNNAPSPWEYALIGDNGEVGVVAVADERAHAAWATLLAIRPPRWQCSSGSGKTTGGSS